jgi:hypothetical protein
MPLWITCNHFKWLLNLKELLKLTEELLVRNKIKDTKLYKAKAVPVLGCVSENKN